MALQTMKDKICLITGATNGIGKVTATRLAKMGAQVGILARNQAKAEQTRQEMIDVTGNPNVAIFIADFSSLDTIRAVVPHIKAAYPRIDVLINNAGGMQANKRQVSADGFELTLAINHLAPFLLTSLLFDWIVKSPEARIINLSSEGHRAAKPDFSDLQYTRSYSAFRAYCDTKLYNLMFTQELANRLNAYPNITTNAVHPGVVATSFGYQTSGLISFAVKLISPFLLTPEQGAETSVYLASSPEAAHFNGLYFAKKKSQTPRNGFLSEKNNKKLWTLSEEMVGTTFL